ncbi:hypothetical protein HHL11_07115 [Ramlibacter sp. G-1-2-2]|uniref:Uncharacterized protein n=2 Tax=Ramlibacter agri TaxID=2728837 RepID=A0A848H1J9_9BURK|nr:hypothetical protein [Ramlibacter agri]
MKAEFLGFESHGSKTGLLSTYCHPCAASGRTIGRGNRCDHAWLADAENEFRKDFTVSERVEIGKALEGELRDQADKRMKAGTANPVENFPEGSRTRDIAAKAAGFGNGKTYEHAKKAGGQESQNPAGAQSQATRNPRETESVSRGTSC